MFMYLIVFFKLYSSSDSSVILVKMQHTDEVENDDVNIEQVEHTNINTAVLQRVFDRNKRISNHGQICCDQKRWCPKFGGHTPSLPPTASLSVKIFCGQNEWGHVLMHYSGAAKSFYEEIRGFLTMHRFVVMRRDDVQSLVATTPPYLQLSP